MHCIIRWYSKFVTMWLQFELVESGYKLTIDGDFGKKTDDALRKFQKSAKLDQDGKCGPLTRKALKAE